MTGASAGLGAGIASVLAREGSFGQIAITYRQTPPDATVEAIRRSGVNAAAARIDFLDAAPSIERSLEDFVNECGAFDTLVHCVGPLTVKRFERLTLDDYAEAFNGNVRSAVMTARAVLPSMRKERFGRIVFFGMNGSSETRPHRGFTLHQAAKSALVAFAKSLAVEEARHGITVNVVEPGDIREKSLPRVVALTREARNPRGRPGSFEDVADVVSFLVAPERDFVTGAVIAVAGGLSEADERNAPPS